MKCSVIIIVCIIILQKDAYEIHTEHGHWVKIAYQWLWQALTIV